MTNVVMTTGVQINGGGIFEAQKVLILIKSIYLFFFFPFASCVFGVICKTSLHNSRSQRFMPVFCSNNILVFGSLILLC